MINYTIGSNGDYVDIGAALESLYAAGGIVDDVTYTVTEDISNDTVWSYASSSPCLMMGFNLTFDLNGHTVTATSGMTFNIWRTNVYDPTDGFGTLTIKNGKIISTAALDLMTIYYGSCYQHAHEQQIIVKDILFSDEQSDPSQKTVGLTLHQDSNWACIEMFNLRFFLHGASSQGIVVTGDTWANDPADPLTRYKIIENCAMYLEGADNLIGLFSAHGAYPNLMDVRNVAIVNTGALGQEYVYSDNNGVSFINCASHDGSITSQDTGTLPPIGPLAWLSVDPTSDNFLKIGITSALYNVGDHTLHNTTDFAGNPRPSIFGHVSCGAFEPRDVAPGGYTIGVGGDFADLNLAINSIAYQDIGGLTGNYYFTAISDFNNVTTPYAVILLNGHTVVFDLAGHTVISSQSIPIEGAGDGFLILKNGNIFADVSMTLGGTYGYSLLHVVHSISTVPFNAYTRLENLYISNHLYQGTALQACLYVDQNNMVMLTTQFLNLKMYATLGNISGGLIAMYFHTTIPEGQYAPDPLSPPYPTVHDRLRTFENCSIYTTALVQGIRFENTAPQSVSIKNTVSAGAGINWHYSHTPYDSIDLINCASTDDTMVDGIQGITDADFISVDPTASDFLKLSVTSKLFQTGTTNILSWNTSDLEGNPRPDTLYHLVSIGCYNPAYMTTIERHYYAIKKLFPIKNLGGTFDADAHVEGKHLDAVEANAWELKKEFIPSTSTQLLNNWETQYDTSGTSIAARQKAVEGAMASVANKDSRLNPSFYERVALGLGYDSTASEFSGVMFVVGNSIPPATPLPAPVYDPLNIWTWTLDSTGSTAPSDRTGLMTKIRELAPAFTKTIFNFS